MCILKLLDEIFLQMSVRAIWYMWTFFLLMHINYTELWVHCVISVHADNICHLHTFFGEVSIKFFGPFLNQVIFKSSLYILEEVLYQIRFLQIFSGFI